MKIDGTQGLLGNSYVRNLENSTLSLETFTEKLVILFALATGQRVQTLSLIDLENIISTNENKIEIKVPHRIKTIGINKTQPILVLPFFQSDPNVCVANTL